MRQPVLTSLIGLRDRVGDRLILLRLDRPDGTRGYMLRVGTGSVFLSAGDLDDGIEAEKGAFASVFASADAKEGISAFLGKRAPHFQGK